MVDRGCHVCPLLWGSPQLDAAAQLKPDTIHSQAHPIYVFFQNVSSFLYI